MIPKPKYQKVQKKKYPPLFPMGECWGCGCQAGLEIHHIMAGNPNRSLSEQYGLYVSLCRECHTRIQQYKDMAEVQRLKQEGQRRFEAVFREGMFLKIFGRSYL